LLKAQHFFHNSFCGVLKALEIALHFKEELLEKPSLTSMKWCWELGILSPSAQPW